MKKKILFIHDSMAGGGAERVLTTVLKSLSREQYDISLLLIAGIGSFMSEIPDDVKLFTIFDKPTKYNQKILYKFRKINNIVREFKARRILGNRHFDTIVSFMEGPPVMLHKQLFDYGDNHRSWIHTNVSAHRWYYRILSEKDERAFYSKVKNVAFVSTESKQKFETIFGKDSQHVVIYNPIDTVSILKTHSRSAANQPFTIISVGRLQPVKRHELLLQTAALLRDRKLQFKVEILGTGPLEGHLKQLTAQLQLNDIVTFKGFVNNPYPDMANADLMCLTSEAEGFGMVVAEALTVGLPVISTPLGCVNELLAQGGGFCVSDDLAVTLADAIEPYMRDRQKLQRLREQAVEAGRQFGLDEIMQQIEAFIS